MLENITFFYNEKEKSSDFYIESGGRGELASCPTLSSGNTGVD